MSIGRWHINRSSDGQFYAVLKARNGKVLVTTETEKKWQSVMKTIESVRRNVAGEIRDNTER